MDKVFAIDCRNMRVNEELSATLQAKNEGGHSLNFVNPIYYFTRQRISQFIQGGVASTLMERQYKSPDDLIVEEQIKPKRKYIVRRLTPTECLRLQGLPDWWVDGANGSDSAIYKMAGNGIAIPCAEDVLGRIANALREDEP